MNVAAILRRKGHLVHTVEPEARLQDAARLLDQKRIGALVVVDERGRVQGVLSERDLVREIARHGGEALQAPVSAAMTEDIVIARPGDTVEQLMGRMTDRRVRHLPVVSDGRLVGLVSIGDVVKERIETAVSEAEAMRDYITTR